MTSILLRDIMYLNFLSEVRGGIIRMKYIEREKLTVINVSEDMDAVSVDTLAGVMLDRPSNVIYCESGEKL